jgi:CRISPR type III-A-associated protein Csm2
MEYNKHSILDTWLDGKINIETTKWAETFGGFLSKPRGDKRNTELSTSQLRKFFGEVKRQQAKGFNIAEFALLKPKLAYAVGRAKTREGKIHEFYHVIAGAIDRVSDEKKFKNFIKIFESIVAYHKASEDSKIQIEE